MASSQPAFELPAPINGSEPGSFAHHTLSERLPNIALQALEDRKWSKESAKKLRALAGDMPHGQLGFLPPDGGPDSFDWIKWLEPLRSQTWLQAPWFAAETYFFRRLVACTGFFNDGYGSKLDPYSRIKSAGLAPVYEGLDSLYTNLHEQFPEPNLSQDRVEEKLLLMLRMNVWGNQADLSLFPDAARKDPHEPSSASLAAHLLVDDALTTSGYLVENRTSSRRVDMVLDNGGLELAYDLALADFLLEHRLTRELHMHAKPFPTYVSDATLPDVLEMVEYFAGAPEKATQNLAKRLKGNIQQGAILLETDFYWTSPLSGWMMPGVLKQELAQSSLVISKGDANYRRWMGDLSWLFDTPVDGILNYLPFPILFLRVFKSNCLAGLQPGQQEQVQAVDPDWLYNGKWGVVQFYPGSGGP